MAACRSITSTEKADMVAHTKDHVRPAGPIPTSKAYTPVEK